MPSVESTPTAAAPWAEGLTGLRQAYAAGSTTPTAVLAEVLERIAARGDDHAWITRVPEDELLAAGKRLEERAELAGGITDLPLYGVPIAVKDNIEVAGMPVTNACPEFAYVPQRSATAVQRVEAAGAVVVGKTNLDQFATGLVGARSPYGACESVFGGGMISGGSSSGSALTVATGVVPVALATDTAGSGRVPAALNGVIGIKPTLGLVSTVGLLPACRSIDGITVMSRRVDDGLAVLREIVGPDPDNPWGRTPADLSPPLTGRPPRLGIPGGAHLEFFGDEPMRAAHLAARDTALATLDATVVEVDLEPFLEAGALLYAGPWVAERYADMGEFVEANAATMVPVVRDIILGGGRHTGAELFRAQHRLRTLRHVCGKVWDDVDALLLPTIGTTFTIEQVLAEPMARNAMLGHYTHFTNLLDLAAIALPAGTTADGRPASLMLIGPPRSDLTLATIAARLLGETG